MRETWFPSRERAEGERRSFDFLDGDVDIPDADPAHRHKRVSDAFLHLARDVWEHEPVARRELQAHLRLTERDVDVQPTPPATNLNTVDRLRRLNDEITSGACVTREREATAA